MNTDSPFRLYTMLEEAEKSNFAHIISWQPHGRCFLVHDRVAFVEQILPSWFAAKTYASFQRQLNMYEFKRMNSPGIDKGSYYNELFLKGRPDLIYGIRRVSLKNQGPRKPGGKDPDFYAMSLIRSVSFRSTQSVPLKPLLQSQPQLQPQLLNEQTTPPLCKPYHSDALYLPSSKHAADDNDDIASTNFLFEEDPTFLSLMRDLEEELNEETDNFTVGPTVTITNSKNAMVPPIPNAYEPRPLPW